MNRHEINPIWHLAEIVSLRDATALVAGYNPNSINKCIHDTNFHDEFPEYYPVHTAISNAIRSEKLNAEIRYLTNPYDENEFPEGYQEPLLPTLSYGMCDETTTLTVDDLKEWLVSRNFTDGFFFNRVDLTPDYLKQDHPCVIFHDHSATRFS